MNSRDSDRPISLAQRFQPAVVHKIGVTALELKLPTGHWAKRARVHEEDLPRERSLSDFREGDSCSVFLLEPVENEPDYYYASLRWADKNENSWYTDKPQKGDLRISEVIAYTRNGQGAIVRLNGSDGNPGEIRALLPLGEVPDRSGDISNLIDIGDQVVVKVVGMDPELLKLVVSIKAALETLKKNEQARREKEFHLETVRLISRQSWSLPKQAGYKIGILGPDIHFSNHLQLWLNAFGFATVRLNDTAHFKRVLGAHNCPTHFVCSAEQWPGPLGDKAWTLEKSLLDKRAVLIWLYGADATMRPPFKAPGLKLPLEIPQLIHLLQDSSCEVIEKHRIGGEEHSSFQLKHIQRLADGLLKSICADLGFHAALWVAKEREGVFTPRASHNINSDKLKVIQPRLAQTVMANSIDLDTELIWSYSKIGELQDLAPRKTDRVLCTPVRFHPIGEAEPIVDRGVIFFYSSKDYPDRSYEKKQGQWPVAKVVSPYYSAMELLMHAMAFARHNEYLSAFADLGRNAASYLHELGQKALPLQRFIKEHPNPVSIERRDWVRIRRQMDELIVMSRDDLMRVRREHGDWLSLKTRLQRLAELDFFRFNAADCAFTVEMPDFPMALALNPMVVDQVINNLLDNALHFARKRGEAGRVTVSVKLEPKVDPDRPLVIEVEDNGSGIRASMAGQLFEPRHSGKSTGTGMGLYISRGFIQELGGKLELKESVRWSNTCFQIRLPIRLNQGTQK